MRMRRLVVCISSVAGLLAGAQAQGYLPLSRTVEAPYATRLHELGSTVHSSIRPYLREEIEALPGADTLPPKAVLPFLDRWAGVGVGSKLRGGLLLDAELGAPLEEKESTTYRAGGGFWADWSPHRTVSVHGDVQAWSESFPEYLDTLVKATQVSLGEGYVDGTGPYTHYDWNAHVDWKASKYFRFTLGRGRNFIGEGHRSMFLSDNTTSYPYFKINTTAWHIRYMNLFTVMNDVRGAGGDPSKFLRKYASFHYLSWNASKRFNFGIFESIIWQDNDPDYPRGFDINYLNPVIVYRPQEYAQGSADNALLGLAVNVKAGKRTTFYGQLMLDEFLLREVRTGKGWFGNKQAFQLGVMAHDAFKVPGLFMRFEFDYVRPFMYTHSDTRQNYAHAGQPLAHPYGGNCHETIAQVQYRRDRWTYATHISVALLGSDTGIYSSGNNIFRPESDRWYISPEENDEDRKAFGYYVGHDSPVSIFYTDVSAAWMIDPNTGMSVEAGYTFRSRVPEHGDNEITHFFRIGISTHLRDRYRDQEVRYVLE